jgi:hypothetical protein
MCKVSVTAISITRIGYSAGGRLVFSRLGAGSALGDPAYDLADVIAHYGSQQVMASVSGCLWCTTMMNLKRRLYWYGDSAFA